MSAMAGKNPPKYFRVGMLLLIAFSNMLSSKFAEGRISLISMMKNYTIESGSYTIECVDMYKQPAFRHPLLKNHTIQKRPTSSPNGFKDNKKDEILQSWKENEKCPKGTIPIARSQLFKKRKTSGFISNGTHPMQSIANPHEYAQVSEIGGPYYGAQASLNVWNPAAVNVGEFSLSQIWVLGGGGDQDFNTIEAGWQVLAGAGHPRFFVYWTRDNYQGTGCYNLECPGFIQTSNKVVLGGSVRPVSTYAGKQYQLQLTIHKDKTSGNWWLRLGREDVGYWPKSILTTLAESSNAITWGGEILNSRLNGKHTSTQMGSGHFSNEGYGKAAYIGNIGYIDASGAIIVPRPQTLRQYTTNAACYDFKFAQRGTPLALHFYFGGPGFSPQCQ